MQRQIERLTNSINELTSKLEKQGKELNEYKRLTRPMLTEWKHEQERKKRNTLGDYDL